MKDEVVKVKKRRGNESMNNGHTGVCTKRFLSFTRDLVLSTFKYKKNNKKIFFNNCTNFLYKTNVAPFETSTT